MKTSLITGGAGFIGSNLCEKLLNDSHKIICVNNLCTGNICLKLTESNSYIIYNN